MAVKTRDEIMEAIRKHIGDDTSDEAISLLEDVTDTFADYETKVADKTDRKAKYDEQEEQFEYYSEPSLDELFTEREG